MKAELALTKKQTANSISCGIHVARIIALALCVTSLPIISDTAYAVDEEVDKCRDSEGYLNALCYEKEMEKRRMAKT